MMVVRLSTRCYPTESRDRIVAAVKNIFPDADPQGEELMTATSSSVEMFSELLKKQQIRDAARAVLRRGASNRTVSFRLNKQVAAIGKVSFSQEVHALGDIDVTVETDDVEAFIDFVAPSTRRVGEP